MKVSVGITPIIVVIMIYNFISCERQATVKEIKECMKSQPAEICIKMHKGI